MAKSIKKVLIIDNGAYTIKAGFSSDSNPIIIPNCVTKVKSERRRPFIGDQLEECKDYSGLYYILPFTKGYIINWDTQRQVWDYVFRVKLKLPTDNKNRFSEIGLIITEPLFNFKQIRENMIDFLFGEYGFGSILITNAPQLAAFNYFYKQNYTKHQNMQTNKRFKSMLSTTNKEMACLVVDSGFSFTHIVPFIEGNKLLTHAKRINVGGKLLTNHLKEVISYRQLNVLDETYVVNQMKEDCCFVSTNYWADLEIASKKLSPINTINRYYVLPDYIMFKRGFIYDKTKHNDIVNFEEHQRIRMNNERFQIPELLFNPGDALINQVGISHCIYDVVSQFNPKYTVDTTSNNIDNVVTSIRERPDNLKDIDSDEDESDVTENEDEEKLDNSNDNDSKKNGINSETKDDSAKQNGEDHHIENGLPTYQDLNIQSHLYNNILLIGGNCNFPNFQERITNDIRTNVRDMLHVRVEKPSDPITYPWFGGQKICNVNEKGDCVGNISDSLYFKFAITRKEYDSKGLVYCNDKLANYQLPSFI
ncbi:hypothetical protein RDWZM_005551 [Blomia tropicalis]|uniref:Actin-related protein 6 n=1 Tax=Blomia tropicalis TaxID=40697 RepID=A0A9Q0M686_BLOTA|nr:hypothetical protein RDWZM_005551 [Blomia tropicalis]